MAKEKPLRVGFVFDDSLDVYDGVAQNVKIFGAWLARQGHHVCYLVGETKTKEWAGGKVYSLSKNQKVSFNGNQARIPLPANRKNIQKVLTVERLDVLHVQMPHSPFLAQRVVNLASPNIAVVGTFHVAPRGTLANVGGKVLRLMYGRGLRRFDHLLSVSSAAEDYAKSSFKTETGILPNVVELDKFLKDFKSIRKTNDIVFLGRLVKRKGAEQLVLAFAHLKKYMDDVTLVIAGDGPEREKLEKMAKKIVPDGSISFYGFIEENDKARLLATSKIACFPSLYGESFGVSLLEAMAASKGVVVAGDNPGYRTILQDKRQLLVDPTNTVEFAGRLIEILENKHIAKEMHAWQVNEVRKYDINVVGPQLLDIYRKTIAKRNDKADN